MSKHRKAIVALALVGSVLFTASAAGATDINPVVGNWRTAPAAQP